MSNKEAVIKFYANFKNGKYFISGKNEKNKFFSLWKSKDFNTDLYFDTDLFKGGLEIPKSQLKLLPNNDGEESKVLVFKNADDEKPLCINKAEIEKRKQQKKKQSKPVDDIFFEILGECFVELLETNKTINIKGDGLIEKCIADYNKKIELQETDDDNLPF